MQQAAKELVENAVIPAFKNIKTFFEETYLPNTREAIGVSATPRAPPTIKTELIITPPQPIAQKKFTLLEKRRWHE